MRIYFNHGRFTKNTFCAKRVIDVDVKNGAAVLRALTMRAAKRHND
nr:MAG TPA_asm: hypothetical protein [Caudoviricetes sp.]